MNLTFNVKNKSLVKLTSQQLTFDVMSEVKFSADIRKELGKFMQTQREAKGLSQKFVAGKIGKSVTQLSRIENGKSGTERDTVIAWAQVVGIDENEALRKFKPENSLAVENDTAALLRDLNDVPPERRAMAIKIARGAVEPLKNNPDFDFDYVED